MSFFDKLSKAGKIAGDLAGAVGNQMEQTTNEYKNYLEKFQNYSDEELIKIVKSQGFGSSAVKRSAAGKILGSRGYTKSDI